MWLGLGTTDKTATNKEGFGTLVDEEVRGGIKPIGAVPPYFACPSIDL